MSLPRENSSPPPQKKNKTVNWIHLIWWKRFSPLAIRGEKEIYEWFVLYVAFFWPSFSWSTVCVLGEWERGWKLSPSWNSLYHVLAQQDCVGIHWARQVHKRDMDPTWVWCQWTEDLSGHALETSRISTYWFRQSLEEVVFHGGSCSTQQRAQRSPVDIKEPHR